MACTFSRPRRMWSKAFGTTKNRRVESYSWNKDFSVLEADASCRWSEYGFFLGGADGKLRFGCDCREWKPESHCAHVIGALLTTINLLTPHLFPRRREDPRYLDALKRMLAGETTLHHRRLFLSWQISPIKMGALVRAPDRWKLPHPASRQQAKDKPAEQVRNRSREQGRRQPYSGPEGWTSGFLWPRSASSEGTGASSAIGTRFPRQQPVPRSWTIWISMPANTRLLAETPRDGRIEVQWDPSLKCRKQTQLNLTSERCVGGGGLLGCGAAASTF